MSKRLEDCPIIRVQQLIDVENSYWNRQLIEDTFCAADVHEILQIPLCLEVEKDQPVWQPERNGAFTFKSAYQMVQKGKEWKSMNAETSHAREIKTHMWK